MKKNYLFINLGLMIAVLFSMLVQSIHSFNHLHQLFAKEECHHHYSGQTEVSHGHHPLDHCFVCEFTLGAFEVPKDQVYTLHEYAFAVRSPFEKQKFHASVAQNAIFLRGPPCFIV